MEEGAGSTLILLHTEDDYKHSPSGDLFLDWKKLQMIYSHCYSRLLSIFSSNVLTRLLIFREVCRYIKQKEKEAIKQHVDMLNKYREQRREEEEGSQEWALKEIKCNWTLLVIKVLFSAFLCPVCWFKFNLAVWCQSTLDNHKIF